jgi:Domain of unknown function (DUF5664)
MSSQLSMCRVCKASLPVHQVRSIWDALCSECFQSQVASKSFAEAVMPSKQVVRISPEGRQDGLQELNGERMPPKNSIQQSQGLGPGGKKNDAGKDRWDLLAPLWWVIQGVVHVLSYGAKTYDDNSWQLLPNGVARYESAAHRHRMKRLDGEWLDSESGLPHIFHELCNQMFVAYLVWKERQ